MNSKITITTKNSGEVTLNLNTIMPSMVSLFFMYDRLPKMSTTYTIYHGHIQSANYEPYATGDKFRVEADFNGKVIKGITLWVKHKGVLWHHARYTRDGKLIETMLEEGKAP